MRRTSEALNRYLKVNFEYLTAYPKIETLWIRFIIGNMFGLLLSTYILHGYVLGVLFAACRKFKFPGLGHYAVNINRDLVANPDPDSSNIRVLR
jgi:hypothetical protein